MSSRRRRPGVATKGSRPARPVGAKRSKSSAPPTLALAASRDGESRRDGDAAVGTNAPGESPRVSFSMPFEDGTELDLGLGPTIAGIRRDGLARGVLDLGTFTIAELLAAGIEGPERLPDRSEFTIAELLAAGVEVPERLLALGEFTIAELLAAEIEVSQRRPDLSEIFTLSGDGLRGAPFTAALPGDVMRIDDVEVETRLRAGWRLIDRGWDNVEMESTLLRSLLREGIPLWRVAGAIRSWLPHPPRFAGHTKEQRVESHARVAALGRDLRRLELGLRWLNHERERLLPADEQAALALLVHRNSERTEVTSRLLRAESEQLRIPQREVERRRRLDGGRQRETALRRAWWSPFEDLLKSRGWKDVRLVDLLTADVWSWDWDWHEELDASDDDDLRARLHNRLRILRRS